MRQNSRWLSRGFFPARFLPAVILLAAGMFLAGCSHFSGRTRPEFVRDTGVLGTWWWWVDPANHDRYLNFAAKNGVNEIYLYMDSFSSATGLLVEKANKRGIKMYFLVDGYNYIWDYSLFTGIVNRYMDYQKRSPENRRFAGLHLDIEPQEHPDYPQKSREFNQAYIDFMVWACSTYRPLGVTIDLDIAWWFDENVRYRGRSEKLYKALILEADRTFVMSYKDTAEKIYNVAKEELEFAKSVNKQIILGAETGKVDYEDDASYYGRGMTYFYDQLHRLNSILENENYGMAIHYISSWYAMTP